MFYYAVTVFVVAYAFIISERFNKTTVAPIGAAESLRGHFDQAHPDAGINQKCLQIRQFDPLSARCPPVASGITRPKCLPTD